MSHPLRRFTTGLCVVVAGGLAVSYAGLKEDVLAFTGNVRAKMIWVRTKPTATDFRTDNNYLYHGGKETTIMCYGTDESSERVLDSVVCQHMTPLINRSGDYVVWSDIVNQKSHIIKWDGTGRRELISGGNFCVLAFQWDAATSKEYIYTTAAKKQDVYYLPYGTTIVKMSFVNGTAQTAGAQVLLDLGGGEFRWPSLVSGDGKYASLNQWPGMCAIDLVTKQQYNKAEGCWGNIAPDTSYRFFVSDGSHTKLYIYASYNATSYASINLAARLPGIQSGWDMAAPRWSNHPGFISVSYPLVVAGRDQGNPAPGEFCLAKFNDAFSDVTAIRITPVGDTNRDKVGDVWLETGEGPVGSVRAKPLRGGGTPSRPVVTLARNRISVVSPGRIVARLFDPSGRPVAACTGVNAATVNARGIGSGAYLLRVNAGERIETRQVVVE